MRRTSPARRKLNATASEWRRKYKEEIGRCDLCGCRELNRLWLHEVTQGYGPRKASLTEPAVILCLCDGFANNCHMAIHQMGKAGKVYALALLYLNRAGVYDLSVVHRIRGDNWPEQSEVDSVIRELLSQGYQR